MFEFYDDEPNHKRATWVGLRTLRQRPRPVGQTDQGDPVYEIRSVPLVMRRDATHFNRLVVCSSCRRELAGEPVFGPADLARGVGPVVCNDCQEAPPPPVWAPQPEPPAPMPVRRPPSEPSADRTTVDLAAELRAVQARMAELAELQEQESDSRRKADDITRRGVQRAVEQRMDDIRGQIAATAEATAARIAVLEDEVRVFCVDESNMPTVDHADVSEAPKEAHALLLVVSEQYRAVALAQAAIEERVQELTQRLAEVVAPAEATQPVPMTEPLESDGGALAALSGSIASVRADIVDIHSAHAELVRSQGALGRSMTELMESHGSALTALSGSVGGIRADIEDVHSAHADLVRSQRDLSRSMADLSARTVAPPPTSSGGDLASTMPRRPGWTPHATTGPSRPRQNAGGSGASGGLLEALDEQLRGAEHRLARREAHRRDAP